MSQTSGSAINIVKKLLGQDTYVSSTKDIDRIRKIWNLKKITSKCLKPKDLK